MAAPFVNFQAIASEIRKSSDSHFSHFEIEEALEKDTEKEILFLIRIETSFYISCSPQKVLKEPSELYVYLPACTSFSFPVLPSFLP